MISPGLKSQILQMLPGSDTSYALSANLMPVGGGSINLAFRLTIGTRKSYFIKVNSATRFPGLFQAEKNGLETLGQHGLIRVPRVIAIGEAGDQQFLVLEWIESGIRSKGFWTDFGKQLAGLHRMTSDRCGLEYDNYMGALPQYNPFTMPWTRFFVQNRLVPQVELACQDGNLDPAQVARFENLYRRMDNIFNEEKPALLHGDLWSGNFMCDEGSQPVLVDPAVYFGHRSMDLAMTTLFGGFDKTFYESYDHHFPLPANYRAQWDICNLYPLLIHLNLFGRGYLGEIDQVLKRYQ